MSLTVRTKKSKILFTPEELFILKEALSMYGSPFYDEFRSNEIYKEYGVAVTSDNYPEHKQKLEEKISKVLEASRVWDFEGFEYR